MTADDVTILIRGPLPEPAQWPKKDEPAPALYAHAQRALDRLSTWEVENRATVSLAKTTVTVFVPGRTLLREEGASVFVHGLPATLIRAFMVNSFIFAGYEYTMRAARAMGAF